MGDGAFDFPVSGRVDPQLLANLRELVQVIHASGAGAKEAGEKAKSSGSDWSQFKDRVSAAAEAFNNVYTAGQRIYGVINGTAEVIARGAGEAQRLSRASVDLGNDFGAAARGAGGVVDELDLLNVTQSLTSRHISMSQAQLQAFARAAQDYARGSGKEFREVGEQLAEVIAKGGEESARFGPALAALAAPTATAQERLAALVATTRESAPAARTAAESYREFQQSLTDAQRAFSEGFAEGLAEMARVHGETTSARDAMRELKDDVYAVGGAAATVFVTMADAVRVVATEVQGWVEGLGDAVQTIDQLRHHPLNAGEILRGFGARGEARDSASEQAFQRLLADLRGSDRTSIDVGAGANGSTAPERTRGHAVDTELGRTGTGSDAAFAEANRAGAQRAANDNARKNVLGIGMDRAIRGDGSLAEEVRGVTGVSREEAAGRASDLDLERDRRNREATRRQRGGSLGDMLDERQAARERRLLDQRIDAMQSFTDRWSDLHHTQVSVAGEAASFLDAGLQGLSRAVATHAKAILSGAESASAGVRAILASTAEAFAEESFAKAGFYAAEAIAALVRYDFPGAGTAAAASVAYLAAGATFGAISGAVAPAAPAAPAAGGRAAPGGGAQPVAPRGGSKSGEGGTVIQVNFGGPVVGGTPAQIGRELGRYINTATAQTGFQLAPGAVAGGRR